MSGQLADGVEIVGKMTALRDDGATVEIAWIRFVGEHVDDAEAFEVLKGGRLLPLDLGPFDNWRQLAAMTGG